MLKVLGKLFYMLKRGINFSIKEYQKSKFKEHGEKVWFGSNCSFSYENITIGNSVHIGDNCFFKSAHGEIIIGNHVMFGPGVHIHGGNHEAGKIGVYMKDINTKKPGIDGVINIEDDVWIGACAIILKGVTIGEGSIIGAGSIVTKDVPPYSVYTGSSNVAIRPRWDEKTIQEHKLVLKQNNNI